MEPIRDFFGIDWKAFGITIFVALLGFQAIIQVLHWFLCDFLGLETKAMREKKEEHELLLLNQQKIQDLEISQRNDEKELHRSNKELKECIENLTKMYVDKEIDDIRWEILDFSSTLTSGRKYNRESFEHIFRMYEKYETILQDNNLENGLVNESREVIKEVYHKQLKDGVIKY